MLCNYATLTFISLLAQNIKRAVIINSYLFYYSMCIISRRFLIYSRSSFFFHVNVVNTAFLWRRSSLSTMMRWTQCVCINLAFLINFFSYSFLHCTALKNVYRKSCEQRQKYFFKGGIFNRRRSRKYKNVLITWFYLK